MLGAIAKLLGRISASVLLLSEVREARDRALYPQVSQTPPR